MNTFSNVETEYIRSSRTVETVLVSNSKIEKLFYVYNYEGYSFRVFRNVLSLIEFFEIGTDNFEHFNTEDELDDFFSNTVLV
ncbi:MAG: hypothetical protein WCG08_02750 [Paludibacter sp.]|jgi:hypothetical protein